MSQIHVSMSFFFTGDICRLKNKCGDLHGSKCDTKFISPLFPPGSYYCKCNPGFVSSSSTKLPIENYVLPGEKCIKGEKGSELIITITNITIITIMMIII